MEEATQQSTQPYHDPRRIGGNNSGLSLEDQSDIICILHPSSHSASKAVAAAARSSPQHILQNGDLIGDMRNITDDDNSSLALHSSRDIALRMSSPVKYPAMGFCFGRNAERCDIILEDLSISNCHFRIYLNKDAVLMLEDTSTNGTVVDEDLILSKKRKGRSHKRTLTNGSIIKTVSPSTKQEARFIVRFPSREGVEDDHRRKLTQYLAYMEQVDRQARALEDAKTKGLWTGANPALAQPILRLQDVKPTEPIEPSKYNLTTTVGYHHGMQWSGGPNYNVVGVIGKGAFATVYKLALKNDGRVFAAKELDKRRFMKNGILDMKVENEMKIMKGLRHPNIVQFVDHVDSDQWLYIIMEYIPGGELSAFVREKGAMPEVMVQQVARQILHALDYLHRRRITHRDIKPDNILISSLDPLCVKLSDFGLSKVVEQETFLKTFCGTLLYCAPEVYPEYDSYRRGEVRKRRRLGDPIPKTSPYSQAVDMWSFGAVLYHVLCNNPPYIGRGDDKGSQMLRNIMTSDADFQPLRQHGVSEVGIDFIARLLNREPSRRPREKECFQHPWIAEVPDDPGFMDIEADDFDLGDNGLLPIDEAEEYGLDASLLNIEDDLGPLDFASEEDEDSVDELAAEHYQSKRPRFGESRVESGIRDIPSSPDVRYPTLPGFDDQRPARLFGEISESALRSSGVLGQNTRLALDMTTDGDRDEGMNESGLGSNGNGNNQEDRSLRYPQTLTTTNGASGSAPSLLGAEALVGQLHMESPGSMQSPVSTPNTNHLVTPETPEAREASPGRSNCPPSDTDSTPKYHKFSRQVDLDVSVHDRERAIPSLIGMNASPQTRLITPRYDMDHEGIPDTVQPDNDSPIDHNKDMELGQINGAGAPPNGLAAYTLSAPIQTAFDPSSQNQLGEFAKPYRCLGKINSLPGSIVEIKIRLEQRMTSWGRGPAATVRYPDVMDTRIPAYGLEVTFWKPNIEQMIEANEDWLQIPDVQTIISTKASNCIWVNGVRLKSAPPEKDGYFFGKLYSGDIITIYQQKDKFLKLKVEILHGLHACERPEEEKPFVIEVVKTRSANSSP